MARTNKVMLKAGREGGVRARGNLNRPPNTPERNPSAANKARAEQRRLRRANEKRKK